MKNEHVKILFIVLFYVSVIGAINWGFHAYGYNLVEKLSEMVSQNPKPVENYIYYVVALCGLAAACLYTYFLLKEKDNKQQ